MDGGGDSHLQIWDDSALVDSWNDAFEEYKRYHSLAAKGEMIEVKMNEPDELTVNGSNAAQAAPGTEPPATLLSAPASPSVGGDDQRGVSVSAPVQPIPVASAASGTVAIPQALLASVQNEDLKNLMMSWYYSGYYTGLYEGKQQGYAMAMQQTQEG